MTNPEGLLPEQRPRNDQGRPDALVERPLLAWSNYLCAGDQVVRLERDTFSVDGLLAQVEAMLQIHDTVEVFFTTDTTNDLVTLVQLSLLIARSSPSASKVAYHGRASDSADTRAHSLVYTSSKVI